MGRIKPKRVARWRRPSRSPWDQMMTGEIGPINYQGRIITPKVIERMRADDPEHAHQLDADWERTVLDNNRPWIDDPEFLAATEALWAEARTSSPEAFQSCGCGDPAHRH